MPTPEYKKRCRPLIFHSSLFIKTVSERNVFMLENLISFICEELGCDESAVSGETLLGELVGDEIELHELVEALENEFDSRFGEEISGEISLTSLADLIEE